MAEEGDTTRSPASTEPSRSRWSRWWEGRSAFGALLAVTAFLVSFSPSLLPRSWLFQAAAAGLSAASAYAIGVLIAFLLRPVFTFLGIRLVVEPRRRRLVLGLGILLVIAIVVVTAWQQRRDRVLTAELVDLPPPTLLDDVRAFLGGAALALVIVLLVVVVRVALAGSRLVLRMALPPWVARVVAVVVVAALIGFASSEFLVRRSLESVYAAAVKLNETPPPDVDEPTSELRSGGPGSIQPWSELGYNGQNFTASGPTAEDIEAVSGQPAKEPIRVYGALRDGLSLEEIADNVVTELERTGAFDREVLVLVGTTGRGWVDEFNASSVEYLTGGDSAIAAMQYSYLPSPVALLTSRRAPAEAGRLLFEKVDAALSSRPAGERPRLYVSGESLGAFGGTAAFEDAEDMLAEVDGAVWIGTPSFTPLWRSIVAERLPGSPEVTPVFEQGRNIRFVTGGGGLDEDAYGREYGPWQEPRVAFLQHASDPIVWWSSRLAVQEPDWIREGVGTDVNPELRWWPLVTFWQVTLDQAVANDPPPGHGHIYEDDLIPVWDAVLNTERTPAEDLDRVVTAVRAASEG